MTSARRSLTVAVATSVVLAGLTVGASAETVPDVRSPKGGPVKPAEVPDVAKGLIVKTTTATPSDALLAATDDALGAKGEVAGDDRLMARVSTVDFDEVVAGDVAEDAAAKVAERADVVWAVPNRLRQVGTQAPVVKNDSDFAVQRSLWNTGYTTNPQLNVPSNGGYSIKAPSLWRATEGLSSTVVAVIDTGILPGHPDLAGKIVPGRDMITNLATAGDGNGRDSDPTDPGDWYDEGDCTFRGSSASSWHGTFVAGQIAAATNNAAGIAAVAPNVKVQAVRALGTCGGYDSDIADAMRWAAGVTVDGSTNPTPAAVVNLSLAGSPGTATQRNDDCLVYNAAAREGKAKGAIYVASAGNDGANANRVTPASCSELISVGATSINGFSAIYSNIGSTVDLSAPGGDTTVDAVRGSDSSKRDIIWSLGDTGQKARSAYAVIGYEGTSMAAPQVAGAAALLHGLGFATPTELTNALYASVSPFRARSGAYAKKAVGPDPYDLNCTSPGRQWCGRGLLDLSRVQVPLTAPVINGTPTVGEPLTTSLGTWVRTPSAPTYVWKVDGATRGTESTYWPTADDIGRSITVTVAPSTSAFKRLSKTSAALSVPDGPEVALNGPTATPTYGSPFTLTATVQGASGGAVELRTDGGTVLGTGVVAGGKATIAVSAASARRLVPAGSSLRAAYLGDGTTAKASSPRRTITSRKLAAKVSTSLGSRVRTTSRATLEVRVLESPDLFANPTGELRVYDGTKRILITRLYSNSGGTKSIRLPQLKKGTHRIKVYFKDSDYIASTYSAVRTITAS